MAGKLIGGSLGIRCASRVFVKYLHNYRVRTGAGSYSGIAWCAESADHYWMAGEQLKTGVVIAVRYMGGVSEWGVKFH